MWSARVFRGEFYETVSYRVVVDLQVARVLADIPACLDMILEEVVVHLGEPRPPIPGRSRSRGLNVEFLVRAVPP